MNLLVKNIGMLVGIDESGRLKVEGKAMAEIATLESAWLLTDGERIKEYGSMESCPSGEGCDILDAEGCDILDAEGGWLFPSFCDSHTHIVFAGSREQEFLDKINGLSYEEIAKRGGGILNSADRLHETSEDELYRQAMERVDEIIAMGTGLVEIKSGYGLTLEDELMITVIASGFDGSAVFVTVGSGVQESADIVKIQKNLGIRILVDWCCDAVGWNSVENIQVVIVRRMCDFVVCADVKRGNDSAGACRMIWRTAVDFSLNIGRKRNGAVCVTLRAVKIALDQNAAILMIVQCDVAKGNDIIAAQQRIDIQRRPVGEYFFMIGFLCHSRR